MPKTQSLSWVVASASDQGKVRSSNEDVVYVSDDGCLLLLGDGMGGQDSGEVAAGMARDTVARRYTGSPPADDKVVMQTWIEEGITAAHLAINQDPRSKGRRGMGTTVVLAVRRSDQAYLGAAGDSRAYSLDGDTLTQHTQDQTVAADLVRLNVLRPQAVSTSPYQHVLSSHLGGNSLRIQLYVLALKLGLILLLCSDGLTGMVEDEKIKEVLTGKGPPEEKCRRLIELANDAGGKDNISCIIAEVVAA